MTREDYRNAVCLEGEKMCGQNSELKLASTVGGNKKGFLKYVNTKKGTTSNIGLLFTSQIGSQTKQTFNVFFACFQHRTRALGHLEPCVEGP